MHNKQQKKSLGFLSIVAFLMILVGVVYTVSGVFATNATNASPTSPLDESPEPPSMPKENLFASLEKQVANKATSLRNGVWSASINDASTGENPSVSETTPTSSTTIASISLASAPSLPEVFDDISTSVYKNAILIGYSNGLRQQANSFHPNYQVRISDFIRVVMDAYRLKQ
ncbi:MAG: hypothetical protein LBG52_04090 [Candidatus Peribacteria bacterium]|jgi:hypothetical protein|nr:hypothetical protein [Candidatus Peribacteria bacterium]